MRSSPISSIRFDFGVRGWGFWVDLAPRVGLDPLLELPSRVEGFGLSFEAFPLRPRAECSQASLLEGMRRSRRHETLPV